MDRTSPLRIATADVRLPDASFYLWAAVPHSAQGTAAHAGEDVAFALQLLAQYNVSVLPGSLLARTAHRHNPGQGRIRMALVAGLEECLEAAHRIAEFTRTIQPTPN